MSTTAQAAVSIIPAQLSYLAIYSPSLGPTDETFPEQLVFYYSRADTKQASKKGDKEEANERLRRIGLAQGLVDFARTFSDGAPVDSAETEKSRIVLHELEKGWWLLASIDLTRIPVQAEKQKEQHFEYSSREVSPPLLLIQQIIDAQSLFSLHHGPSLQALYRRLQRERFCSALDRFWSRFARTWDVLLHGNPAVDALSGIKLASGGELGFGVGEEDWGSSERSVLEDITRQTEGLVDSIVARFGEEAVNDDLPADVLPWVGGASLPAVHDGVIFGGINGISRRSLQSVSLWMRHIYTYGDNAYGVRDNPSRERRRRKRRQVSEQIEPARLQTRSTSATTDGRESSAEPSTRQARPPLPQLTSHDSDTGVSTNSLIPPPIVSAAEAALTEATRKADAKAQQKETSAEDSSTLGIPDQYLKYLTLGLSSYAKSSPKPPPKLSRASTTTSIAQTRADDDGSLAVLEPMPDGNVAHAKVARQKRQENQGHFIIGLKGDVETIPDDYEAELTEGSLHDETEGHRTVLRTLYVEKLDHGQKGEDSDVTIRLSTSVPTRLRVVIYARRPFLYCFLFEQRTSSLSYASFYRSLHRNLVPIHKQLLRSTQPSNVADRVQSAKLAREHAHADEDLSTPVYDVMYDPVRLTVHATVPNIPEPGSLVAEGILSKGHNKASTWSRLEALNVHSAMLNTLAETKRHYKDTERTSKTSRGWWVVWIKLLPSDQTDDVSTVKSDDKRSRTKDCQIAFVVRKAGETTSVRKASQATSRAASGMWNQLASTLRAGEAEAPLDRIASLGASGGIGFDARRYIEGLLSLNR